jgi:hypothetical protein
MHGEAPGPIPSHADAGHIDAGAVNTPGGLNLVNQGAQAACAQGVTWCLGKKAIAAPSIVLVQGCESVSQESNHSTYRGKPGKIRRVTSPVPSLSLNLSLTWLPSIAMAGPVQLR